MIRGTVRVWDAESGKPVGEPMRDLGEVRSASFSPDGRLIVSAAHDETFVWDVETGKQVGSIPHPGQGLGQDLTASFSPDGRRIVSGANGYAVRVWDAKSDNPLGKLMLHQGVVTAASFSPDGRRIVTASRDNTARVWDAESGKPIGEPMLHRGEVLAANFSPDGRRIVTASRDNTARVWDAESGKPIGEPMLHQNAVWAASFSPDGRRIVTAFDDNTARVWDVAVDLDLPLPSWVPELAEALGGRKFNEEGQLEFDALFQGQLSPKGIIELRNAVLALKGADFWSRFGRWFFMRGPKRTISPDSKITVGEFDRVREKAEEEEATEPPEPEPTDAE